MNERMNDQGDKAWMFVIQRDKPQAAFEEKEAWGASAGRVALARQSHALQR